MSNFLKISHDAMRGRLFFVWVGQVDAGRPVNDVGLLISFLLTAAELYDVDAGRLLCPFTGIKI